MSRTATAELPASRLEVSRAAVRTGTEKSPQRLMLIKLLELR
jgi:hypothetical protein